MSTNYKRSVIYHHNDHDGIVAAGIAYNFMTDILNMPKDSIETVMIDYGTDIDLSYYTDFTLLWFLDYSFTNEHNKNELLNYFNRVGMRHLIWIDHHISSFDIPEFNDLVITGLRHKEYCGAVLTYLYTHIITPQNYKEVIDNIDKYVEEQVPEFLKLIDDYDCWKKKNPRTDNFHYGLSISDPKDVLIRSLIQLDDHVCDTIISDICNAGEKVVDYLKFENKIYHCDMYGFEVWFHGYKCFALNRKGPSTMFGEYVDEYDIVIPYYYDGYLWRYSLFTTSENIDCEEIARKHGGGGHEKAAGFQTKDLIFKDGKYIEK